MTDHENENRDFAMGTIAFELDMALTSTSGRPKHTDIEEQGAFLLDSFARYVDENWQHDDATILRVAYMGEVTPGAREPHDVRDLSGGSS